MVPILRVQEKPSKCHRLIYLNSFFRRRRSAAGRKEGRGNNQNAPRVSRGRPSPSVLFKRKYILRLKKGLFFLILPLSEQVPKGDEPGETGHGFPVKAHAENGNCATSTAGLPPKVCPLPPEARPSCPPPLGGLPALPAPPGLSRQLWSSRQRSPSQDSRNPAQDAHGSALPSEGRPRSLRTGQPIRDEGRSEQSGRAGRSDGFGQTFADLEALPRRAVTALFLAVPRQNAFAAIKYRSPLPNHQ